MSVYVCPNMGRHATGHGQKSEDRLMESVLSFYWVDSKGRVLVIHLGDWIL